MQCTRTNTAEGKFRRYVLALRKVALSVSVCVCAYLAFWRVIERFFFSRGLSCDEFKSFRRRRSSLIYASEREASSVNIS